MSFTPPPLPAPLSMPALPTPPGIYIPPTPSQQSDPTNNQNTSPPPAKKKYCTNCGDMTHPSKECKEPIMSCGIILYRRLPNHTFQYLMICRRNTIGLVEIIRGRYDVSNVDYIRSLVNVMSQQEIDWVKTATFDELWKIVWREHADNFLKEKKASEDKYVQIYPLMLETINAIRVSYKDPEWGFPKGRRNYKESHKMAAIRELKEETSITPNFYRLHNEPMFEESYVSYDGKHYKNIYYIAQLHHYFNLNEVMRVHHIRTTSYEISEMKLFTLNECLSYIRDYSVEKKTMIMEINHYLQNVNVLSMTHTQSPHIQPPFSYQGYYKNTNNNGHGHTHTYNHNQYNHHSHTTHHNREHHRNTQCDNHRDAHRMSRHTSPRTSHQNHIE